MADKTDTAESMGHLIQAVKRMTLEYEAARYVLKHYGAPNWAVLLHDYRSLKANKDRASELFDVVTASLRRNQPIAATLTSLVAVIDKIVPVYPSQIAP